MLAKRGQIWIGGVQNLTGEGEVLVVLLDVKLLHRIGFREAGEGRSWPENEADEAGSVSIPGALSGSSVDVLANPAALAIGAGNFGADGPTRKEALALTGHVAVETVQHGELIRREALGTVGTLTTRKILSRTEVASSRVVDDAILEPVFGVALFIDARGEEFEFGGGKRLGREGLLPVDAGDLSAGVVEAGRSCDDAVEIGGKALREDESLTPTGGAAVEIRFGQRIGIVSRDEAFGGLGGDVQRAESKIDKLLPIDSEGTARFALSGVARVG